LQGLIVVWRHTQLFRGPMSERHTITRIGQLQTLMNDGDDAALLHGDTRHFQELA
jgi:hypothetical protein